MYDKRAGTFSSIGYISLCRELLKKYYMRLVKEFSLYNKYDYERITMIKACANSIVLN